MCRSAPARRRCCATTAGRRCGRSWTGRPDMRFAHRTLGQRVVLDPGGAVARIRAELDRLEPHAIMVIGGKRHAALMDELTGRTALRWTEVAQHVPEPL